MTEGGISKDINDATYGEGSSRPSGGWLWKLIMRLINLGNGVNHHYVTTGTGGSPPGSGQIVPIAPEVDRVLPRFTIVNNGANPVNIGYQGNPTFPLPAGLAYTCTWKNPRESRMCFSDLGNAATVDVIS